MPSLAHSASIRGLDVNGKNIIAAGVILLVITALIFLPEIMSSPEAPTESVSTTSPIERLNDFDDQPQVNAEPAFVEVDENYVDPHQDMGHRDSIVVPAEEQIAVEQSPSPLDKVLSRVSQTSAPVQVSKVKPFFSSDKISTWEDVLTEETTPKLQQAKADILSLAKSIAKEQRQSRFALLNYADGIGSVLSRGESEVLGPKEVVPFLSELDARVTQAMISDNLDRSFLLRWSEISLGPQLESSNELQQKLRALTVFRPKIQILNLSIEQPGNHQGNRVPSNDVGARIIGQIQGRDLHSLVLYRANSPMDREMISLSRPDGNGMRRFNVMWYPKVQNTAVIFEATDLEGNIFEKIYNFHPRVLRFTWGGSKHRYNFLLPFTKNDPRLDAYFAVGTRSKSEDGKVRGKNDSIIGRF